jgi:hypothetical protein
MAVGAYVDSSNVESTLIERWNGSAWSVVASPRPTAASLSILFGVACLSPKSCTAVGAFSNRVGLYATLAETWNGTTWSLQATPNPHTVYGSSLSAVGCSSATNCTAVGFSLYGQTLVERWNGHAWTLRTPPRPAGAKSSVLTGVACTPVGTCTVVGYWLNALGGYSALAARSNGRSWTVESPNPPSAKGSVLNGVACPGIGACTAVGDAIDGANHQVTLAEVWGGKAWTPQTTASPVGGSDNVMSGVDCLSQKTCVAVGTYAQASGVHFTLIEAKG